MKFRCLIVEDQVMFLDLLLIALRGIPRLEICRTARTFAEASEALRQERYDIAILDYMLPDGSGLDLARELGRSSPNTVVVMLTAHIQSLLPQQAIAEAGRIRAVVDKVGSLDSLRAEIEAFIRERDPQARTDVHPETSLTRRELEIFRLVGEGLPNKQIAARLFISQRTVESHRKTISRKMGMSGSELVRHAALFVPGSGAS
ncbi:MAG: response regulator transcription factor [Verrucomicrobia bacterium]|nr:response regulator transcription factor [Verrucomicrobiota bacterium]